MSGGRHAVASATARRRPATPAALQPSAAAGTVPSTRMNTNAGSSVEPERLHRDAVGIGEHEELVDERTEEGAGVVGVGGDEEVDPGVRAAQALEDARRRRQDPRALVGVGVEHDRREVERRQPLLERSRLAAERGQHQVRRRVRRHGVRR